MRCGQGLGAVFCGFLVLAACGKTSSRPHEAQVGPPAQGGNAGVPSDQPLLGGAGASAGEPAGAGGIEQLPLPRHPLIIGDDVCPLEAPQTDSCGKDPASCIYRGIEGGLSETVSPMACSCDRGRWSCVSSDEQGDVVCPFDPPAEGQVDVGQACPPRAALPCFYQSFTGPTLYVCNCAETLSSAGGGGGAGSEGGAGGGAGDAAEIQPSSSWLCGS